MTKIKSLLTNDEGELKVTNIYDLLFLKATGEINEEEFNEEAYNNRLSDCY